MTPSDRWIIHADMDAFYASVEQRDFPAIKGLPVVVGGDGKRGVVAAASYEARKFGIRSAMPMSEAHRRCETLVVQALRMSVYQQVSRQVFSIFEAITPEIEGLSLDEAFLDISASLALLGDPIAVARGLKSRVREITGLNISVGLAPNKLVAKIASDLDKPDGFTIIAPSDLPHALDHLPINVLPGIGPKSLPGIHAAGLRTLRDMRLAPAQMLDNLFGKYAARMRERAAGIDRRKVGAAARERSISAESTFHDDLFDKQMLQHQLIQLIEKVTRRVRNQNVAVGTLALKIRRSDFKTYSRQQTLTPPTSDTAALYKLGCQLLATWRDQHPQAGVRLLGVAAKQLRSGGQTDLFTDTGNGQPTKIDTTVDEIDKRFGPGALTRGRGIKHPSD